VNLIRSLRVLRSHARFVLRGHGKASRTFTHLTYEERLLLYQTVLRLGRNKVIVEIGSYLGASSCFLAAGAQDMGSTVYCIDTWGNDGMTEGLRDTYSAFQDNTRRYQNHIVPLRCRSEEAVKGFEKSIDMLFLDGDHSYEGVSSDLQLWLPKLRFGSWLFLHDSGWAEGVQRAIKEVVASVQSQGLIVLPNLYGVQVDPGKVLIGDLTA
jgi:predicted O-methyltransferase YrrM